MHGATVRRLDLDADFVHAEVDEVQPGFVANGELDRDRGARPDGNRAGECWGGPAQASAAEVVTR